MDGVVHLCLIADTGLEAQHGCRRRLGAQQAHTLTHDRVLAGEAACLQFLHGAFDGEVGIPGQQFLEDGLIVVDDAAPLALAWLGRRGDRRARGPLLLDFGQHPRHRLPRYAQLPRDDTHRRAGLMKNHDLMLERFVHDVPFHLRVQLFSRRERSKSQLRHQPRLLDDT